MAVRSSGDARQDGAALDPALGRASYIFNPTIEGIERADAVLACSDVDAQGLQELAPGCKVHVVANGVDLESNRPATHAPDPDRLVFVGQMGWFPNRDGVEWFLREVFPRFVPSSLAVMAAPASAPAPGHETTYVICEEDQAVPVAAQQAMSARSDRVERLPSSHNPMLSMPERLAQVLETAATRDR